MSWHEQLSLPTGAVAVNSLPQATLGLPVSLNQLPFSEGHTEARKQEDSVLTTGTGGSQMPIFCSMILLSHRDPGKLGKIRSLDRPLLTTSFFSTAWNSSLLTKFSSWRTICNRAWLKGGPEAGVGEGFPLGTRSKDR